MKSHRCRSHDQRPSIEPQDLNVWVQIHRNRQFNLVVNQASFKTCQKLTHILRTYEGNRITRHRHNNTGHGFSLHKINRIHQNTNESSYSDHHERPYQTTLSKVRIGYTSPSKKRPKVSASQNEAVPTRTTHHENDYQK